jgi:hypothetical protein
LPVSSISSGYPLETARSREAKSLLEKKGIEIIKDVTPAIRSKFNELSKTKKVTAIIHVTC